MLMLGREIEVALDVIMESAPDTAVDNRICRASATEIGPPSARKVRFNKRLHKPELQASDYLEVTGVKFEIMPIK